MAERSDVLIHHGGYGSCQTGLCMGKPAVIIPTYTERESNARRIAALGAGAMVPVEHDRGKKQVRVEALRAAIRRVLTDPSIASNRCSSVVDTNPATCLNLPTSMPM